MEISEFQKHIEQIYYEKDSRRGLDGSFMWFVEEIGELSRALRGTDTQALEAEFADVLAWLSTLASISGVDLEAVARLQYADGCPKCHSTPCVCPED